MSRIDHRPRWVAALVAACLVALLAAPRAQADVPFMVVPQAPMVSTPEAGSDEQGRTDQTSVAFEVEGSWTQLSCQLDDQTDTTCGTPVTPCPVAQCTMVSRSGLRSGSHELFVTDPYGDSAGVEGVIFDFFVDLTPPHAYLAGLSGAGTRPTFEFDWNENDESVTDTGECSLTLASAPPSWAPCPGGGSLTATLPRRHVEYLFRARAVDDLGRASNVIVVPYDPVPCSLAPIRPLRALQFEVYGVPLDLRCAPETQSVETQIYLLGENGRNHSLAWAIRHYRDFSDWTLTRRLTRHGRQLLEPDDSLDIELKQDRTARLALVVTPTVGPRYDGINGVTVIRYFELRNRGRL